LTHRVGLERVFSFHGVGLEGVAASLSLLGANVQRAIKEASANSASVCFRAEFVAGTSRAQARWTSSVNREAALDRPPRFACSVLFDSG